MSDLVFWLDEINQINENMCGDKVLSLFKIKSHFKDNDGIFVPEAFIISAEVFHYFLEFNDIKKSIFLLLDTIIYDDLKSIYSVSKSIQDLIIRSDFPSDIIKCIEIKYNELKKKSNDVSFAVRSSSNDEDGEKASFAGQQTSFLHVENLNDLINKVKLVYASLYGPQSLSYRKKNNILVSEASMGICIQRMVRADLGLSGVVFTVDPQSSSAEVVSVSANYGLGESIVQGISNPDEYLVHKLKRAVIQKNLGGKKKKVVYGNKGTKTVFTKPFERDVFCLKDSEIIELSIISMKLENFFGYPLDIEWAWDGVCCRFYILQARPITTLVDRKTDSFIAYKIFHTENSEVITSGKAIGKKAISGVVKVIDSVGDLYKIESGDILVTNITDPHWEPAMKIASGIITNLGGRTCHAAIIARELAIPAIVGTNDATQKLKSGQKVTLSCCQGDIGYVYAGEQHIEKKVINSERIKCISANIMLNINNPNMAFEFSQLPNDGVGLARMEFIINNYIGIHPYAIINYETINQKIKKIIVNKIKGYQNPADFYISKLYEGLATIAAAFYPKPVTIRLSDFKTNEYRNLLGGLEYEIIEENPMIGFRGVMRYISKDFHDAFLLELAAIKKLIYTMKFDNVSLLIPFVRTVSEAKEVMEILASHGVSRSSTLKIYIMCEIPSNALLAEEFLEYCDGFSIGSNDMTQLVLGIDRDGGKFVNADFDEKNDAMKAILKMAITACKKKNKYIGICGQGASDNPGFADWLIKEGIDSISVTPDSIFNFHR